MTDEQIARLMDLQKLYEEGILNKDDLAKEKAKILGVKNQVSETQKVVNTENSTPVTLKVKVSKDGDIKQNSVAKNPTPEAEIPITNPEPQPETKKTAAFQKPVKKTEKPLFEKLKIPIFVVAGILILWGGFNLAKRYKYIFSKSDVEDSRTYEDKFERLWVIGSSRDYTEDDFKDWNKEDLRILRNYFFARNNFRFGSKELTNYFSKYSWYQALYSDVGDMFSDLQTNNVQFIKKLEGLPNYHH